MANPTWKKGGISPNPMGRAKLKSSARTIKGAVERFVKRNYTPNKLQAIHDSLSKKERLQMYFELLPYCTAKQSSLSIHSTFDKMSDADLEKLYGQLMGSLTQSEPIKINENTTLIPSNYNRYGQD